MPNWLEVGGLKREFRKRWTGWMDTVEPSLGSGMGVPDLLLLLKIRGLPVIMPTELKIGSVRKKRIYPSIVRGSQVRWHFHLSDCGGCSSIVIGVSPEEAYLIDSRLVLNWKNGFVIGKEATRIFFEAKTSLTLRGMFETFWSDKIKNDNPMWPNGVCDLPLGKHEDGYDD